jgi:zinc protease
VKILFLSALLLIPAATRAQVVVPPPDSEPVRAQIIPPGPQRPFGMPALRRARTSNGIAVTATEIKTLPIVAVSMLIPAASAARASLMLPGSEGIAAMTAALLDENTKDHDGKSFALALEKLGATFTVSAAADAAVVTIFAMKDSLDGAMALAAEAIGRPSFRAEDVARLKEQAISSLKEAAADPEQAASRRLSLRVYGMHPYGASATPATIAAITPSAIARYHAQAYQPQGVSIHAAGDITVEELKAMAEKNFAGWSSASISAASARAVAPIPLSDRRAIAEGSGIIDLIDMPGTAQPMIKVGQIALPRGHADYPALRLLSVVLGGPNARIETILREEKHWAYYARSSMPAEKEGGMLILESKIQSDKAAEAAAILKAEMRRLREEDVSIAELDKAKKMFVGAQLRSLETIQSISAQRGNAHLYGLGDDALAKTRDAIEALTPADIRRVAAKYLRPETAPIVIFGDASRLKGPLEKLVGPVRVLNLDGSVRPAGA